MLILVRAWCVRSRYARAIAARQTGDTSVQASDGYAVELESYEEGGREFFRPKGTGERLEKERERDERLKLEADLKTTEPEPEP